ncbi:MAG: LysR family transcriptional regulator [Cohaesibacter sp.]|jgi:DNA-binding transcriptional LysR family regulator|nr:LysR family transcriptional regulator [Cohaesibacter sp.]
MDWDKLRIFHAAADAGSFTHAGDKLHMSQSAISRQVSSLELDLGVTLFHRHARGLILTEQGELLYRTAHDVLMKLETVRTHLTDSKEKPTGELRLTTTVGLGTAWLTQHLPEFMELYPGIALNLILENEDLDLGMREADVAIRLHQPTQPDLIQRKLFTVHFHIFASATYLKQFGQPETLSDLDDHRIICFGDNSPNYLRDINWLESAGLPQGKKRPIALKVDNILAIRSAVMRGAGIAMLPDYVVHPRDNLVQLLTSVDMPSFDTYFVYAAEMRNSMRINAIRDFLLSKAASWHF